MLTPNQTFPAEVGPDSIQKARRCEAAFQGNTGKQINYTLGASPQEAYRKLPKANCQGVQKRNDLRGHTNKRRRKRRQSLNRGGEKEEKKDTHSTIKWDHWQEAHINFLLYISIKNTWHSINYTRGCHNYQGHQAEGIDCYFYLYLNKRHPSNWRVLENTYDNLQLCFLEPVLLSWNPDLISFLTVWRIKRNHQFKRLKI